MKKKTALLSLCLLFCLFLTVGCASASDAAAPQNTDEAEDETSLHFTQEITVKKEKYLNKAAYRDFLASFEKSCLIPGLNQAVIPQGMDYSEQTGLLYISGYYKLDDVPSVLMAVDPADGTLKADYRLFNPDGTPFVSHVGGVAAAGDYLVISAALDNDGSYSVALLPLNELAGEGGHDITVSRRLTVPVSPSFLNCSDGVLWLGNFYHPSAGYDLPPELSTVSSADGDYGCYILGWQLDDSTALLSGTELPDPDYVLFAPDRIQGMTVTVDGTVRLSQSYGRKNDSSLLSYRPDLSVPDTEVKICGTAVNAWFLDSRCLEEAITAMPMTEALCTDADGDVLLLFESGAMAYSDGVNRTDHIWRLSAEG